MKTQLAWTRFDEEAPEDGRLIILVRDKEPHSLDPLIGRFDEENESVDINHGDSLDVSDFDDEMPLLWAYFTHPTDKFAYAVEEKDDEEEEAEDDK